MLVPSGTIVDYNVYALHRREDIYGPDCNEFKPERWVTLRAAWEYLPFSGGPRLCLGRKLGCSYFMKHMLFLTATPDTDQLAITEVAYTTVRLLQEFKSVESRDPEPWREALTLTCASANGTKVAFTPHDPTTLHDVHIDSERGKLKKKKRDEIAIRSTS